jgi:hypothetical protein
VFTSLIGQAIPAPPPAVIHETFWRARPVHSLYAIAGINRAGWKRCSISDHDLRPHWSGRQRLALDEATAAAEAMALAERREPGKIILRRRRSASADARGAAHRAEHMGWNRLSAIPSRISSAEVFSALLQYPGASGALRDLQPAIATLHAKGALAVVAADLWR